MTALASDSAPDLTPVDRAYEYMRSLPTPLQRFYARGLILHHFGGTMDGSYRTKPNGVGITRARAIRERIDSLLGASDA